MPQRRKRSAAITLVLAGSLSGCSEPVPQRDVYASIEACQRDWNQAQQCEPVRDNRYSNSWFYGPRYYGSAWPDGTPRSNPNAVTAMRDERAASTRTSSSWFRGGSSSTSTSRSSTTSRGGFGSSGRSSAS